MDLIWLTSYVQQVRMGKTSSKNSETQRSVMEYAFEIILSIYVIEIRCD